MDFFLLMSFLDCTRAWNYHLNLLLLVKTFLSACFCWNCSFGLREMYQNLEFDGTIGFEDSYSELLFRHFKEFRVHAKPSEGTLRQRSKLVFID